jgi:biotin-(acetyl-CoA carboxylase) ligase
MVERPKTLAVLADIQLQGRGTQVGVRRVVFDTHTCARLGWPDPSAVSIHRQLVCDPIFSANCYRLLHSFTQTHTQGRNWERGIETTSDGSTTTTSDGNLYLTVCIPMASVPATITLLPLQIAVLVAQRVAKLVAAASSLSGQPSSDKHVKVKWPNDVLIAGHKVSGTLIENEIGPDGQTWLLIGIGVNVLTAPRNIVGKRKAGCLQDYCTEQQLAANTATILGTDIAMAIADWIMLEKVKTDRSDETIVQNWRTWVDLGQPYELRGAVVDADGHDGEIVTGDYAFRDKMVGCDC